MKIYTIGFTKKTAEQFFNKLKVAHVRRLMDIRLRPDSQLAGFAKRVDLQFFLEKLNQCTYIYEPRLAPSDDLLKIYRENKDWNSYESGYFQILNSRQMPQLLDRGEFENSNTCLLCSEDEPENCHRRLIAQAMQTLWGDVQIIHL